MTGYLRHKQVVNEVVHVVCVCVYTLYLYIVPGADISKLRTPPVLIGFEYYIQI